MKRDDRPENQLEVSGTSAIEWIVAGAGAIVVLGTIGAMLFFGLSESGRLPAISFEAQRIEKIGDHWLVGFIARNDGDATAAALEVVGVLMDGETVIEESEVTFDYLPGNSQRQGGLFFSRDPSGHDLRISGRGYAQP